MIGIPTMTIWPVKLGGDSTFVEEIPDGGEGVCKHCSRPIREAMIVETRLTRLLFKDSEEEKRAWVHNEDNMEQCMTLVATPEPSE